MKQSKALIQIHDTDSYGTLNPSIWLEAEYLLAKSLNLPIAQLVNKKLKKNLKISEGFNAIMFEERIDDADIISAFEFITKFKDNNIPKLLSEETL